jgi:uncharacterized protein YjiS (DUF1127 family)
MFARTATVSPSSQGRMLPHGDLPAAALGTFHAMIDGARWAVWRWYQVRRTARQVSSLPDHLLKDIGLSRMTVLGATIRRVREEEAIRRGACW